MNLYLVEQKENQGSDTYDSAVVAAPTVPKAIDTHPDGHTKPFTKAKGWNSWWENTWCPIDDVKVTYLGKACKSTKAGVICASFNAG